MNESRRGCSADEANSSQEKVIKTVLLSMVMAISLTGNTFIIVIVSKKRSMRKTTNFFIANMAASDMLIAAVVIPRILKDIHVGSRLWLLDGFLGIITCKFCFFLTDFSVGISILSHTAIAFDRFWAIVYSLRPPLITPSRRKYIIAGIWLFSFCIHSPNLYAYRLKRVNGQTVCKNSWSPLDDISSTKIYFCIVFVIVLCIPVLLMTTLYISLIVSLLCKNNPTQQPLTIRQRRREEDIRVLRKVIILLVVFVISFTPITVFAFLALYSWGLPTPCDKWDYSFIVHFILLTNCAINPWLCIGLNEGFLSYIKKGWHYSKSFKTKSRNLTQRTTVRNVGDEGNELCNDKIEHVLTVINKDTNDGKSSLLK